MANEIFRILLIFCVFLLSLISADQVYLRNRYSYKAMSRTAPGRLSAMMRSTYIDVVNREQQFGYIRYLYEDSPQYEMGWVFGEIIERYKKMTEQVKRLHEFKHRTLYEYFDGVEMIQKLYFEIYHFAAMMHEIEAKFIARPNAGKDEVNATGVFLLSLISADQVYLRNRYSYKAMSRTAPGRLSAMMRSTYIDVVNREQQFGYIRYLYEDSPQYEMGWVFGEIIERYKKMTEQVKRLHEFKHRTLYEYFDGVEMIQKLYFEIYHFAAMMHEIEAKFIARPNAGKDEVNATADEQVDLLEAENAFKQAQKEQQKMAKKAMKKQQQKQHEQDMKNMPPPVPSAGGQSGLKDNVAYDPTDIKHVGQGEGPHVYKSLFPKKFPLDYGWEIEGWGLFKYSSDNKLIKLPEIKT